MGAVATTRIDHFNDPDAPKANSLIPGASAVVVDEAGAIPLYRRDNNDLWSVPGGSMEVGESIRETIVREVKEETGLDVEPQSIVGIYSDQQFSVCFTCKVVGGRLATGDESLEVGFFTPAEIESLPMHDSIRLRIRHFLERRPTPVIA